VPDEVCAYFKDLGDYDYRPAREVAEGDEDTEVRSVIDVDILGHIFEQSITDLERLRLSLEQLGSLQPGASAESPSPALAGTLSPSELIMFHNFPAGHRWFIGSSWPGDYLRARIQSGTDRAPG
jgi:hypothetical protein